MLNLNETSVAQHYDQGGFEYESTRLQERSPVEFAMTSRYLNRWIPERTTVADIGVGVGNYAEGLAQRGCQLYLVAMMGVESFSAPFATTINTLEAAQVEAWMDLVEATGKTPEGLAMSDHFLYVGKKK